MITFDLVTSLQQSGINYKEKGTNVGRDFVNIDCPFCLESRQHCGIHMQELWFKCFVCGKSGGWNFLVNKLMQTFPNCKLQHVQRASNVFISDKQNVDEQQEVLWKDITPRDMKWLTQKSKSESKYQARAIKKERLVDIDVFSGTGKLKGFVVFKQGDNIIARAATSSVGKDNPRWWKRVNERPFLFGYDACTQQPPKELVIVEGVFDCLRFPYGTAVAILSSTISQTMLNKIISGMEDTQKIILALDRNVVQKHINDVRLSFLDVGFDVSVFDWDNFDDKRCKDVDEIAYYYGEAYLHELIGFTNDNNAEVSLI